MPRPSTFVRRARTPCCSTPATPSKAAPKPSTPAVRRSSRSSISSVWTPRPRQLGLPVWQGTIPAIVRTGHGIGQPEPPMGRGGCQCVRRGDWRSAFAALRRERRGGHGRRSASPLRSNLVFDRGRRERVSLIPSRNSLFRRIDSLFRRKISLFNCVGNSAKKTNDGRSLRRCILLETPRIAKIPCIFPGYQGIARGERFATDCPLRHPASRHALHRICTRAKQDALRSLGQGGPLQRSSAQRAARSRSVLLGRPAIELELTQQINSRLNRIEARSMAARPASLPHFRYGCGS